MREYIDHRHHNYLAVHGEVLLRQWLTREAGYGIMSTVPYEQQKLYRQIILLLHGRLV